VQRRRFSVIRLPTSECPAFLDVDFILFDLMMKIGQRCSYSASNPSSVIVLDAGGTPSTLSLL